MRTGTYSIIMGAVLGALATGVIVFIFQKTAPQVAEKKAIEMGFRAADNDRGKNALATVEGGTRQKISVERRAPEPTEVAKNAEIAIPTVAVKVGKEGTSALRTFTIQAEKNKFTPSIIIVNELDVIEIELFAADKEYGIVFPDFGVVKQAKAGEKEKLQFQAYPFGEYAFFCDKCGEEPAGKLIVNEKR